MFVVRNRYVQSKYDHQHEVVLYSEISAVRHSNGCETKEDRNLKPSLIGTINLF